MNAEQFAMWAQGMFEYRNIEEISHFEALKMLQGIKDHVALVFKKVTPKLEEPKKEPTEADKALEKIFKDLKPQPKIEPIKWPQTPVTPLPYYPPQPHPFWMDHGKYGPGVITC